MTLAGGSFVLPAGIPIACMNPKIETVYPGR